MFTLKLTQFERSLLIEALTRAASRRNSMSKVPSSSAQVKEQHEVIAAQMLELLDRIQEKRAA